MPILQYSLHKFKLWIEKYIFRYFSIRDLENIIESLSFFTESNVSQPLARVNGSMTCLSLSIYFLRIIFYVNQTQAYCIQYFILSSGIETGLFCMFVTFFTKPNVTFLASCLVEIWIILIFRAWGRFVSGKFAFMTGLNIISRLWKLGYINVSEKSEKKISWRSKFNHQYTTAVATVPSTPSHQHQRSLK